MQELKCKICGGSLTVDHKSKIAVCDYCGTKQILPLFSDESAMLLYERGGELLRKSEYDKAESIFYQLLPLCPEDPEIYWDLVLCKYGVQYVKDPQSGKYLPTCNRTHYSSVLNDENYKKSLEYASAEQSKIYEADAQYINDVQKKIISIAKKEKPFDIFISYKETNADGSRTKDSIHAQEIYRKLTEQGYKVFFSRITLESKAGTEYEPYIYAALATSKVMLHITSSNENSQSVWVKNEWSRFLSMKQNDSSKTLIPLYFDMQKSDLPPEFENIPSYDMLSNGFEQELFRGIKKLIPLPVMKAEKRRKARKRAKIFAAVFVLIIVVSGAVSFPHIKEYVEFNSQYQSAMQLYNDKKYNDAAAAFEKISSYKDSSQMQTKSLNMQKYTTAMQLYYDSNYPEAAWVFRDLNGFSDSDEMQEKCELAWRESLARTVTENYNFTDETDSSVIGSYYITSNGTVNSFDYNVGTANENINIDKHGKIVSIASNRSLYALQEDGHVINSAKNNQLDNDWENIIQISDIFNYTSVALNSDGKMVYGDTSKEYYASKYGYDTIENDKWIEKISEWEDIVSFDTAITRHKAMGVMDAAIVGLKSDGTAVLDIAYADYFFGGDTVDYGNKYKNAKKYISEVKGAKKIFIGFGVNNELNVLYIKSDGTVEGYVDSQKVSYENVNVKDIEFIYSADDKTIPYLLLEDGSLLNTEENNSVLYDIVKVDLGFAITKSGNIYLDYSLETPELTEAKTVIYDSWKER